MNKTEKSTAAKENAKGPDSPAARDIPVVAVESLVSPLNATERPAIPAKSTHHKKKETADDCKARKAAEGTPKSSKTKAKVFAETGKGPSWNWVTILSGSTVINCVDGTVPSGTPMLVLVYNTMGRIVAMLQVPENLPPPPISAYILRGKAGRCSGNWKNLQAVLEDSDPKDYLGESEQGSDEEVGYPTEEKLPSDNEREEDLIPNPKLWSLGCEEMLRSVLPSKRNLKKARRRETEL